MATIDNELKKLSREDLLEMLVNQSREVERLKEERKILLAQLSYLKDEFSKAELLEATMSRMGIPYAKHSTAKQMKEIDSIILAHSEKSEEEFI